MDPPQRRRHDHAARRTTAGSASRSIPHSSVPEVLLTLQWPDGHTSELYSPSTVILEHLPPGTSLSVGELEQRGVEALRQASERVRARYGFACTRTDEEREKLRRQVAGYATDQQVKISKKFD